MQLNEAKLDAQPEETVFKKDKIEKVLICEMSKERNNEQECPNPKKPNLFEIIRATQPVLLENPKTEVTQLQGVSKK